MQAKELKVVLDEEMQGLVESLGILQKIEAGEALCAQCGTPVSVDTIAFIVAQPSAYLLVCSTQECVERQLALRGEQLDAKR